MQKQNQRQRVSASNISKGQMHEKQGRKSKEGRGGFGVQTPEGGENSIRGRVPGRTKLKRMAQPQEEKRKRSQKGKRNPRKKTVLPKREGVEKNGGGKGEGEKSLSGLNNLRVEDTGGKIQ